MKVNQKWVPDGATDDHHHHGNNRDDDSENENGVRLDPDCLTRPSPPHRSPSFPLHPYCPGIARTPPANLLQSEQQT